MRGWGRYRYSSQPLTLTLNEDFSMFVMLQNLNLFWHFVFWPFQDQESHWPPPWPNVFKEGSTLKVRFGNSFSTETRPGTPWPPFKDKVAEWGGGIIDFGAQILKKGGGMGIVGKNAPLVYNLDISTKKSILASKLNGITPDTPLWGITNIFPLLIYYSL